MAKSKRAKKPSTGGFMNLPFQAYIFTPYRIIFHSIRWKSVSQLIDFVFVAHFIWKANQSPNKSPNTVTRWGGGLLLLVVGSLYDFHQSSEPGSPINRWEGFPRTSNRKTDEGQDRNWTGGATSMLVCVHVNDIIKKRPATRTRRAR